MTFRGNLLLYSLWYELHPFENLRRKGHHCHGLTHLSWAERKIFYRVLGKKFCGLFIYPGQSVRQVVAGMPGAQATARQRRRDRNGRCKPGVFTHRTVAAARSRASGFGGDWQVRQQLPVGVGPDDRMPPGSREPKVRPADRTTLQ